MIAAPNAKRPLINDTINANHPRVRHPSTSTGVVAITKNSTGAATGINMWREKRFMPASQVPSSSDSCINNVVNLTITRLGFVISSNPVLGIPSSDFSPSLHEKFT